jgi:hypothetical protein
MYMGTNSIYKIHTVGNMRNTYLHGNEQHILNPYGWEYEEYVCIWK